VRVGIFVGGRSVGGPAGMTDSELACDGFLTQQWGEAFVDFAFPFPDLEAGLGQNRDAGAIVAAVFQAAEASTRMGAADFLPT